MQNNTKKLILTFSIALCFAIVASFIFGFFGAKLSFDWSGGNQIKIVCEADTSAKDVKSKASALFAKNHISVESSEILTNGATEIVVLKTQEKSIKNNTQTQITNELNALDGVTTDGFERVYSSFNTAIWLIPFVPVILCISAAIVLYIISRRISDLITLLASFITASVLMLSFAVLARVQLGSNSVAAMLIGAFINVSLTFALLLSVKKEQSLVLKSESTLCDICKKAAKSSCGKYGILFVVIAAAAVVCSFVGTAAALHFGIMLILSLIAALYVSYFISLQMKVLLEVAFENRYNAKMKANSETQKQQEQKTVKRVVKKHSKRPASPDKKVVV